MKKRAEARRECLRMRFTGTGQRGLLRSKRLSLIVYTIMVIRLDDLLRRKLLYAYTIRRMTVQHPRPLPARALVVAPIQAVEWTVANTVTTQIHSTMPNSTAYVDAPTFAEHVNAADVASKPTTVTHTIIVDRRISVCHGVWVQERGVYLFVCNRSLRRD
jgi:hypothetical protein